MSDPVPFQTRIRVKDDEPVMANEVFHAMLRAIQHTNTVKSYMTDIAHDAECIYTNANQIVGLGYCVRECGTHCFPFIYKDEKHRSAMLQHIDCIAKGKSGEKLHWLILCDPTLSPECLDGKYSQDSVSFIEVDYPAFRKHFQEADIH